MICNDVELGVEMRGSPTHPPLVLLHGFTGSAASWGAHLDVFAAHGLHVIALDMLGHGRSDAPADPRRYAIERCSEDIVAALQSLGIQAGTAILLGYSMGGRIALYTAFSGFFRALILASVSPGLADADERVRRRSSDEALAARLEHEGVPAFVDYWEHLPLFASQQRLPQLAIPTLLLAGELDDKYCTIAREMAHALPHTRLEIVPDAGHTIHLEQPAAFDRSVCAFCDAVLTTKI